MKRASVTYGIISSGLTSCTWGVTLRREGDKVSEETMAANFSHLMKSTNPYV